MVAAHREAEEQRRRESEWICAAIEQQIQQARQQNVINVRMKKRKPRRPKLILEEIMAMVDEEEE